MILITIALIAAIAVLIYLFLTWNYSYWKKLGVPGPEPKILLGNYTSLLSQKQNLAEDINQIYRAYKQTTDFVGIYNTRAPQLLIVSPALARRVYVTDFKHFHDNEMSLFVDEKSDFIFANNPFVLAGEKWKERRAEVTPGLTTNRIKSVYPVTKQVCKRLVEFIDKETKIGAPDGIDGKNLSLRYTADVVTDCVLGVKAESFADNPSPIVGVIKNLFQQSFTFLLKFALLDFLPSTKGILKIRFLPKDVEKFFIDLLGQAASLRRAQTGTQSDRVDFMNYLLELQKKKNLNDSELTAHTMTFLFDGFETTAGVIAHCLLLLGRNKTKQNKLHQEISENLNKDGDIDFDKLNELSYLDACVHESIRIFPPGLIANKVCTEPITLVNKDGSSLEVRKGQTVVLPIFSFMRDEEFYTNANEFIPERFLDVSDGVKAFREQGVYYGFGDGPRVCIGMRFALTQTKAALVEIIKNFVINVNYKTRSDNWLDPKYFLAQLEGGIWLNFERRN